MGHGTVGTAASRPAASRSIGKPLKRHEDPRLLRGEALFVADVEPPGTLHAAFVRAPLPHGRVSGIDTSQARALDGIAEVMTGADFDPLPGPIPVRVHPIPGLEPFLQYALATDTVRYVGEPVAVVVARDRYMAEDAVALVDVDYEPLDAVPDMGAALAEGAPLLFEPAGTNVAHEFTSQYGNDIDAVFADAEHVVGGEFEIQRHSGVPMETRGLVAWPDGDGGRLTVWGPTKVVHANRQAIAELLGIEPELMHFVEPAVGGGFGVRGEIYPEDLIVPLLAWRLGAPVKWIEDRQEHMVSANQSRGQRHDAALALDADGRILGMRSRFWVDQGAYVRTHGVRVAEISAHTQPGPYHIPSYRCDVTCVLTNRTPTGTYRAPGRFEINFVRERLIDMAAARLGIAPVDLRRRNFVRAQDMPYERGTYDFEEPIIYDSGDPPAVYERTLEAIGYDDFERRRTHARAEGRCLGIGVVPFVEDGGLGGLGGTPGEHATVALEPGGVVVYTGSCDLGQGFETVLAQVCGEELDMDPAAITVVHGDTDRVEAGGGTWASRGAILSGNATLLAARTFKDELRRAAATELGEPGEELTVRDGRVLAGDGRAVELAQLATAGESLRGMATFTQPRMTYSPGAQGVVVEVDEDTGFVHLLQHVVAYDVGRALNPLVVRGQIEGGAAQGVGGALLEEFAYDESGQPIATSFMDYLLPTAGEIPPTDVLMLEDAPSPLNPLGVKGVGEVGPPAAGAAIAAAVADALGVHVPRLPLTPERVRRLIEPRQGAAVERAHG